MWRINMTGTEYAELAAFMAVASERSFRRAAQRLGLSPSALSHTIRALETRLGARLLNRTTRSVAPTEAGQQLFARLQPVLGEMDAAVREVGAHQDTPRGTVRVNLPRIAAQWVVGPILADFLAAYPGVRLDLVVDDSITDVVAGGFDAGIRSGELVQQDMVAIRLTPDLRMAVVGAPAYLARHPASGAASAAATARTRLLDLPLARERDAAALAFLGAGGGQRGRRR